MSAIAAMRAATWPSHQRLEKALDIGSRLSSIDGYRAYLQGMWGFCGGLETRLEGSLKELALPDYVSRRKLPLLGADLAALGDDPERLRSLPRCEAIPDCADIVESFGCAYVLEGATLGGRTMLPLVHKRLGLTPERGAAFFASYGDNVTAMWRTFGVAFDRWCGAPEARAAAAAAALATFESLTDWLCGGAA